MASRSGSRLTYLKFVASNPGWDASSFWLRDPGWDTSSFVAWWSRCRLEHGKFCGYVVEIPVGTPRVLWLRGQDPGWDTLSWWLRDQDPGWDTLGYLKLFWLRSQDPRSDTSSFVASWWYPNRDPDHEAAHSSYPTGIFDCEATNLEETQPAS